MQNCYEFACLFATWRRNIKKSAECVNPACVCVWGVYPQGNPIVGDLTIQLKLACLFAQSSVVRLGNVKNFLEKVLLIVAAFSHKVTLSLSASDNRSWWWWWWWRDDRSWKCHFQMKHYRTSRKKHTSHKYNQIIETKRQDESRASIVSQAHENKSRESTH